jgi:CxxC-x17-CxxC domain-containing protein
MSPGEKTVTCIDCGSAFVFTADERERSIQLGFTDEPRRCPSCRRAKKTRRRLREAHRPLGRIAALSQQTEVSFVAVCVDCGKRTQLPFRPKGDRPVYCSDCYGLRR